MKTINTINELIEALTLIKNSFNNTNLLNNKSILALINRLSGTAWQYCPSCPGAIRNILRSFEIFVYRAIRNNFKSLELEVPNFQSFKYNTEQFKNELFLLPIEYIINNINDGNRIVGELRQSRVANQLAAIPFILSDIELLQQYRDMKYQYLDYVINMNNELEKHQEKEIIADTDKQSVGLNDEVIKTTKVKISKTKVKKAKEDEEQQK